jgi:hypothetical protein
MPVDTLPATRKGRNSFDAWQEHIRKSSALARNEIPSQSDTVCVFRARAARSPREFARRLRTVDARPG